MKLVLIKSAVAGLAIAASASLALAQAPAAAPAPAAGGAAGGAAAPAVTPNFVPKTVFENLTTATTPKLTLTSTSIKQGQPIADTYSQNGANKSPQLTWTAGPAATKTYVVIAQDPYMGRATPIQHWILWNVPATTTMLPEGVATTATLTAPQGAMQASAGGAAGYRGPKPPAGQTHTYVFQVFALDAPLTLDPDPAKVNADAITAAMKGHVLAAGELSGTYAGK